MLERGTARVLEVFPLVVSEPEGDGRDPNDFLVEFLVHGLTDGADRYYPKEVVDAAVNAGVYDGAKMFMNHLDLKAMRGIGQNLHRDMGEWVATLLKGSVHSVDGRIRGTAHVHSARMREYLDDPVPKAAMGLSQDAILRYKMGTIDGHKGVQIVEQIMQCNSVDFVPEGNAYGVVLESRSDRSDDEMEIKDLTLAELQAARPDLIAQIGKDAVTEAKAAEKPAAGDDATARKLEALGESNRRLTLIVGTQATTEAVRAIVDADAALSAPVRLRVVESFAGQVVEADKIADAVKIAVERESAYAKALLAEAGAGTRVAGLGRSTEGGGQTGEYSEENYKRQCEDQGVPYIPRPGVAAAK